MYEGGTPPSPKECRSRKAAEAEIDELKCQLLCLAAPNGTYARTSAGVYRAALWQDWPQLYGLGSGVENT